MKLTWQDCLVGEAFLVKPDDLNSVLSAHLVEGKHLLHRCPLMSVYIRDALLFPPKMMGFFKESFFECLF